MTDVSKWNLQMYIHSRNRVDTSKTEHIPDISRLIFALLKTNYIKVLHANRTCKRQQMDIKHRIPNPTHLNLSCRTELGKIIARTPGKCEFSRTRKSRRHLIPDSSLPFCIPPDYSLAIYTNSPTIHVSRLSSKKCQPNIK